MEDKNTASDSGFPPNRVGIPERKKKKKKEKRGEEEEIQVLLA